MAKKLEIVELNLGIDAKEMTTKPVLTPQIEAKIDRQLQQDLQEQQNIQKYKQERLQEEEKRESALEAIYKELSRLASEDKGLNRAEILQIANSNDVIGTMVRLGNLIKKHGSIWKLHKSCIEGITIYKFKPNRPGVSA